MLEELGENEGQVNILAWPGYAEDGSTDPAVDWVTPFEEATGCEANVKYFATSDEAVQLMKTGEYDVVSASGDASLRLIAAGDVEPVNTDLIDNYADVYDYLKDRDWNSVDGQMYGVPHGYGANLLMWRTDEVDTGADQLERRVRRRRRLHRQGDGVRLADLHRRRGAVPHERPSPTWASRTPTPSTRTSSPAAVDLLKAQREHVGEYWSDYLKEVQAFTTRRLGGRHDVAGHRQRRAGREGAGGGRSLPEEGVTGWSDTWMVGAESENKNCAYAWMNHIISPEANAAVAEYFGEAPANAKACDIAHRGSLRDLPRRRRGVRRRRSGTGPRRSSSAWTVART